MASWRYTNPISAAGIRNSGKKKLGKDPHKYLDPSYGCNTHATVRIAAKNVARDPFTACIEPASEESMVITSFSNNISRVVVPKLDPLTLPKRLSIRPMIGHRHLRSETYSIVAFRTDLAG
jgi:hypothetical protein